MHLRQRHGRYFGWVLVTALTTWVSANGAMASSGCTAVNSGVFNFSEAAPGLPGTNASVSQAGFEANDQISVTVTHGDGLHYSLSSSGTSLMSFVHPSDGETASATLVAGQTVIDLTIWDHTSSGTTSVTATCTPGTVASSDSDKARAVQNLGSRIVARASAQAISDATSSAVAGQIESAPEGSGSPQSSPASNLGGPKDEPLPGRIGNLGKDSSAHAQAPRGQITIGKVRLWSDVRSTRIVDGDDQTGQVFGWQINATSGVGLQVHPGFVVGALTAFEHFDYEFRGLGGRYEGDGYSGGLYVGGKLTHTAWYSLMGTYSRLANDVSAGTATGSFDSDRWIVAGTLTGRIPVRENGIFVEPSANLLYVMENQDGWTDSLGTDHNSREFQEGRLSLGAKLGTIVNVPGAVITPHIGAFADYYFGSDTAMPVGFEVLGLNHDWSMRAVAGVNASMAQGYSLSLEASYGGIGDEYQTISARGGFSLRY